MKWLMQSSVACSEFLTLSLCHSRGWTFFTALHCAAKTDTLHWKASATVRCPYNELIILTGSKHYETRAFSVRVQDRSRLDPVLNPFSAVHASCSMFLNHTGKVSVYIEWTEVIWCSDGESLRWKSHQSAVRCPLPALQPSLYLRSLGTQIKNPGNTV
jgi:hypothetical protein